MVNGPASEGFEGVEVQVGVRYEPSSLAETRAVLMIVSPEGGGFFYFIYFFRVLMLACWIRKATIT